MNVQNGIIFSSSHEDFNHLEDIPGVETKFKYGPKTDPMVSSSKNLKPKIIYNNNPSQVPNENVPGVEIKFKYGPTTNPPKSSIFSPSQNLKSKTTYNNPSSIGKPNIFDSVITKPSSSIQQYLHFLFFFFEC